MAKETKLTVQRAARRLLQMVARGKGSYAVTPNTITVDDTAKTVTFTQVAALKAKGRK